MPAIDGLSSGLDTTSIIKQLMQLERIPQQRLQSRQSAAESSVLSLRTLNSKFLAISTAAAKFGAALPGAPASTKPTEWQLASAASSDTARASVQAVAGAPDGALVFHVEQLAKAASYLGSSTYAGTGAAFASRSSTTTDPDGNTTTTSTTSTSLLLTKGSGPGVTINTGTGSLADTVAAINSAKAGVTASTVQVTPGQYKLQLTSTTTGAASGIRLEDPSVDASADPAADDIALLTVNGPQDAKLVLGSGAGATVITRSSNTLSDVLEGVTLTLSKADAKDAGGVFVDPPVTVTVKKDAEGIAAKVQALVDAANAARSEAKSLTAVDPTTKAKGRLYGDSSVRSLVDRVRAAIVDGDAEVGLAGVTVARDGTVSFDKAKFLERLAADPAAVEAALGKDGMAGRLHRLADETSRVEGSVGGPGLIISAIKSRESQIDSFKSNIIDWDARLALKEKTLNRQYTALETALGKAKSQGAWLSSQLAGLPTSGGSA